MKYFLYCLKHYVDFNGRAPRAEFWYFVLFNLIIALVVGGVGYAIGFSKLSSLYSLLVLLPTLAVSVRRLQDTGKSGWFILVGLIPLVGALILSTSTRKTASPVKTNMVPTPRIILHNIDR